MTNQAMIAAVGGSDFGIRCGPSAGLAKFCCAIGLPLSNGRLCTNGQSIEDVVVVPNVLGMSDGKAQAVLGFAVAAEPD